VHNSVWGRWGCAALLALSLNAAAAESLTPAQIASLAIPSVVLIRIPQGVGTGFVVGADGRIATNAHVIRGAKQATIVTSDKKEYDDVEVLAVDEAHDLALLRIKARDLKPLTLGDSSKAKPGEHVVAIGNPLGFGSTVSDGLLSAIRDLEPQRSMLQISAPISPGSSGGPVFNDRGEVIGVSTLVVTTGQNLNFAEPIDVLKPLLKADHGTPIAQFNAEPAPKHGREVRKLPDDTLAACPREQLKTVVERIQQAITVGAPLYNQGDIESCYRVYASAVLDIDRKVPSCAGPRKALLEGLSNADHEDGWGNKAWALRDSFDSVLELVARSSGRVRQVPHHDGGVLAQCDRAGTDQIADRINGAINNGAPQYNKGNIEACYWIYAGAINEIDRKVAGCPAAKQALRSGLDAADQRESWDDKAWALRDAFDGLLEAIGHAQPPAAP